MYAPLRASDTNASTSSRTDPGSTDAAAGRFGCPAEPDCAHGRRSSTRHTGLASLPQNRSTERTAATHSVPAAKPTQPLGHRAPDACLRLLLPGLRSALRDEPCRSDRRPAPLITFTHLPRPARYRVLQPWRKARPYLGRQAPGSHLAVGCYVISVQWRVGSIAGSRSTVVGAGAPNHGPVSDSTCPIPK